VFKDQIPIRLVIKCTPCQESSLLKAPGDFGYKHVNDFHIFNF